MSAASDFHGRGADSAPEGAERGGPRHHSDHGRCGPPLPIKLLGVAGAFWIAPPLGLAALGYWAWRAWRGQGGCDPFEHAEGWRDFAERKGWRHCRPHRSSGNSALDERRRELCAPSRKRRRRSPNSSAVSARRATARNSTASWPSEARRRPLRRENPKAPSAE